MRPCHHFCDLILDPEFFAFKFVETKLVGKRSLIFFFDFPIYGSMLDLESYNPFGCWHTEPPYLSECDNYAKPTGSGMQSPKG